MARATSSMTPRWRCAKARSSHYWGATARASRRCSRPSPACSSRRRDASSTPGATLPACPPPTPLPGLLKPASGRIEYAGRDIPGLSAPDIARMGIGYVPQGRGLFSGMTVAENLSLGRLAPKTDGSTGTVWSEEKNLQDFPRLKERLHTRADFLSGGEQQMVAVARALSGDVRLLLLDEPFEGLAPAVVQELFTVFDRLRKEVAIVIVEHNLDLVLALADRVFALERGAVFHTGPAAPLLTDLRYRKQILWL